MKVPFYLIFFAALVVLGGCSGKSGGSSSAAQLVSLAVTPLNPNISPGLSQQFTATGTYSDDSTRDLTASVTWNSSDPSVAMIGNKSGTSGLATGVFPGTTRISASIPTSFGAITDSTALTVKNEVLISIAVTPKSQNIAPGTTQQFTATGAYSDSSSRNITASVIWISSNTSVATISNKSGSRGLAAGLSSGTTAISAVISNPSNTLSDTATLTVKNAALVSIAVTPQNRNIAAGTMQQFTAMGTFSDSSSHDLTSSVTWNSSDTSVATISNVSGSSGLAAAVSAGTTTVTADSEGISANTTLTVTAGGGEPVNVMPVTVNGSLCSPGASYLNKPCVSVTVCSPGTTSCQTINDILLDTGSTGMRLFKQVLTVPFVQVMVNSQALANCIHYGDGSSQWGPVQMADVVLGGEPAVQVPIQVIDASFATLPPTSNCQNADQDPATAGFNGILGVSFFAQDCGPACETHSNIGFYYGCSGGICGEITVPLSKQMQNPVALLPQDNNGILLQLPAIPAGGVPSVDGSLILGIGTRSNNMPSGETAFKADSFGNITTTFNGTAYDQSFLDSGSNGLFFLPQPTAPITTCAAPNNPWFCPSATLDLMATVSTIGASVPTASVSFQIANLENLTNNQSNHVFNDIGASLPQPSLFDWGLPFFLGRDVYIGIEGKSSSLGTGTYVAF